MNTDRRMQASKVSFYIVWQCVCMGASTVHCRCNYLVGHFCNDHMFKKLASEDLLLTLKGGAQVSLRHYDKVRSANTHLMRSSFVLIL